MVRGTEHGYRFESSTNQVQLIFNSDRNVHFEGFQATFQGNLLRVCSFSKLDMTGR